MDKRLIVSVIFGTRPEAIKLAPVILALRKAQRLRCHVCVTAQHRQMLDQALQVFGIAADADLNLMTPSQTLAQFTAACIAALDKYLARCKPDLILVQGDTTTAFCAALAGFYRHIPVGHVEAGLRTGDMKAPWPEEANRVLVTRLATLHFAPTETSRKNLLKEGVPAATVVVTGNTVIDALHLALDRVRQRPPSIPGLAGSLQPSTLGCQSVTPCIVLITGHRREAFGEGFENICRAVAELARRFPHVQFVYPVHLNPHVQEPVFRILGQSSTPTTRGSRSAIANVHLIEPLAYLPFVALMSMSTLILTDSGGIQEEAPGLGKPVLVMRDVTERPEGVKAGAVRLVGTKAGDIVQGVSRLLRDPAKYRCMSRARNPYGDGRAAKRIMKAIRIHLAKTASASRQRRRREPVQTIALRRH